MLMVVVFRAFAAGIGAVSIWCGLFGSSTKDPAGPSAVLAGVLVLAFTALLGRLSKD